MNKDSYSFTHWKRFQLRNEQDAYHCTLNPQNNVSPDNQEIIYENCYTESLQIYFCICFYIIAGQPSI